MDDRRGRFILILLAPILLNAESPLWAAPQAANASGVVRAARFERPPVIDGRIDDEAWTSAARIETFHQVQPGDNLAPSQSTTVLIGYDRRALYLAFRAEDTSGRVRATLARRDAITDDDVVGVYLDTFHDRRRAYYIFFNPYGIQADGIYTEGKPDPDLTVDLVIDSKGTIDANGYTVEAAIPFASLRYQRGRGGEPPVWGLHVQRFIRRDRNEQISWMPLSRNRSSLLDQAGTVGEFVDVGEGRPLEVIPTGVLTDERVSTADAEPGISVNFGMTPTMNAAFTANPDFAQVEADQLVLTANQRFPIFYDEKRPFFLEGIDAFQTPINLIHTRTIVDPDYALKLTGKYGRTERTTVGALYADDGADGAKKAAFRLKRDFGRESTVGATLTTVEDGETFSRLVSADTRVRLSDQTVLTAQIAGSFADVPFRDLVFGGTRQRYGRGLGYHAKLERRGRHVVTALTASGSSQDYRADLGFTRRANTNGLNLQTTYNSEPRPDARLISWTATNITVAQWDWQGRADWVYIYPQLHLNFRRQTSLHLYAYRDYERLFEEEFGVRRGPGRAGAFIGDGERSTSWEGFIVTGSTAPSEAIALTASISRSWDVFDYDFGAGPKYPRVSPAAVIDPDAAFDPGPATSTTISGEITWRPMDPVRTSMAVSRDTLVRNDNRRTAYDTTLVSWRTTYQFTRFTFARLRTDWDSANATLRGQYLVGWTPTPGTAIYAGFNDVATIDGVDPVTGVPVPGFRRNGRTLFVKLSYMLRRVL
jgi:hypothetical protein